MAALALAAVGTLQELAAVGIGFVTIRAQGVGNRRFEVAAFVTGEALDFKVLAEERKVRFGVIECRCERGSFPTGCVVARLTSLFELALVGIRVAGGACGELQSEVSGLSVGARGVALFAGGFAMGPGERVARLGVVEMLPVEFGGLPVDGRVTLSAIGAQAALVLIRMA